MKLNRTRPYGVISGHESASYEQDGLLFDAAGNQLAEYKAPPGKPGPKPKTEAVTLTEKALNNAKDFLRGLLGGGPLDKSVVYKEAENYNQHWDTFKLAFADLAGREQKRGQATLWSLNYEQVR